MANTADREVWLNFLDEVDEYLNTIESVLIGIAETGVDPQQMDAALRAAHTIKGIGSMIECPSMSQLAHRFEDSLKIVKVRRSSVQLDTALEILLLQGLDSVRQISTLHRQGSSITESWLSANAYPRFDKLHSRLGDIQPSEELALLAEESEDNTAVIMFGTEVEVLLERLQSILDLPESPCLREELEMMVEELHDLGKMLQLDRFISLCESIYQYLIVASPEHIEPLAQQSLEIWQRSQALVLVGQLDKLPTELVFSPSSVEEFSFDIERQDSDILEAISSSPFFTEDGSDVEPPDETFSAQDIADEDTLEPELVDFEPVEAVEPTASEVSDTPDVPASDVPVSDISDIPDISDTPDISELETLELETEVDAVISDNSATVMGEGLFSESIETVNGDFVESSDDFIDTVTDITNAILKETAALGHQLDEAAPMEDVKEEVAEVERVEEEDAIADSAENTAVNPLNEIDLAELEAAIENFDPDSFQFYPPVSAKTEPFSATDNGPQGVADEDIVLEPEPQIHQSASFSDGRTKAEVEEFEELFVEPVEASTNSAQKLSENTVRVPLKLLTQLNDLFGELIIQRNTMNSRLDQMEDLITLFSKRMVNLEVTNTELQAFCNQMAVDTSVPVLNGTNGSAANHDAGPARNSIALSGTVATLEQAFDTLELDRYSELHLLSQDQRETLVQLREVTSDVKLNVREVKQASSNLNRTAKALQVNVTRARMLPLSDVVERFPRTVRDLSLEYGKTVDLKISGGGTLIDRFVAVQLRDPLMHLLRNAFDHGIEDPDTRQAQGKPPQGTIEIKAVHRGSQTLISISDDGTGINLTKIRARACQMGLTDEILDSMSQSELLGMIFEPGFSTATQVTNLSGRGIGMDVVRTNLEQIRSEVKVDTQPGLGTTFTISVPFTLSIMRVLLVESGGMRLAFPTNGIEEMIRLSTVQVFDSPEQKVINWDGLTVPLIHLDQWLKFQCPRRSPATENAPIINEPSVLIIGRDDQLSGIHIERFWGEREVVIRQVENVINLPPGFNGCTILEDGHVVPLADPTQLLDWIDNDDVKETISHNPLRWQQLLQSGPEQEAHQPLALPQAQQTNILVVDDSINMRQLLRTTLEQAGYGVEQGKDGQDAVDQLSSGLSVDAIVCDIEMPRLDGYGVLAEIKADAMLKHLPIIMLTSRGSDKHRQLAMRLGAEAYITKPYQDHELLQMLEQVLQQQPLTAQ